MAVSSHPLRHPTDGEGHCRSHPTDQGPLVSLGQGDYRREIKPDDILPTYSTAEGRKALRAIMEDTDGVVPLSNKPKRDPKLERQKAAALAKVDQAYAHLESSILQLMDLAMRLSDAENKGESYTLSGRDLEIARVCLGVFMGRTLEKIDGGAD